MTIPASGWTAVPLLKKKLTSDSTLALARTAADGGVRVTDADAVVLFVARAGRLVTVFDGRGFVRLGPACAVGFDGPLADELLEPVESADATAGMDASAAPTPSATAEAPTQVSTLRCPGATGLGGMMPPNSAGSVRR
ncbi:hypothetical protein [Mycobacterium sp. RTGN5]|uniref:hypothetical protein n=1 Tax=Mycobacterium sp. RTGN5 TaxID=3016522 RepID=UPI0029C79BC8|nr:hypothetical protein [Mycobacterium sp. RTGN5]